MEEVDDTAPLSLATRESPDDREEHWQRPIDGTLNFSVFIEFLRPFTLLPPLLGVLSGCGMAWASARHKEARLPDAKPTWAFDPWMLGRVVVLSICVSLLNAASNTLNQIYDLDIDKINKPLRVLPSRRMSMAAAWAVTVILFLAALVPVWFLTAQQSHGDREYAFFEKHVCFWASLGCAGAQAKISS